MRKLYVGILVLVTAVIFGASGFVLGAGGGGILGGYFAVVEGVNQGSLATADYIANNSDAQYVPQGNGDLILYIPNATNTDVTPSKKTGYTPVLYYNNSSGTWDNYPIRKYAAENLTNSIYNSTPNGTPTTSSTSSMGG